MDTVDKESSLRTDSPSLLNNRNNNNVNRLTKPSNNFPTVQ